MVLLSLIIILLDSSIMFTISATSIPGSGALMGGHGLHSIDRTFRRMIDKINRFLCNLIYVLLEKPYHYFLTVNSNKRKWLPYVWRSLETCF